MFGRGNFINFGTLMAILAVGSHSMHFIAGVTIHANHLPLTEMYICFQVFVFSQIFISNPAAMASCAVINHGWYCVKYMSIDESTIYRGWAADMAITTRGVTAGAVIIKHFLCLGVVFRNSPRF